MSKFQPCPSCTGGRLEEQTVPSSGTVAEWRCNQCGLRKRLEEPSQALPARPLNPELSSKPSRKMKTGPVPRKVSIPNLSPPPVPRSKEDCDGAYEIQCRTYAAYKHFQQKAVRYRKKMERCRTKKTKLRSSYRARLCEKLARTLGRIYLYQAPKALRKYLREQHRKGHPVKETNRRITTAFKRYCNLMLQAMVPLADDPVVRDWADSRKALGDRKYLRGPRKSLEKGVPEPYKSGEEALADLTTIELWMEGMSPGKIRDKLKAQGLPARSREGIRIRLKSISIQVSESPPPRRSRATE